MKSLRQKKVERDYRRTKVAFWIVLSFGLGIWAACVTHEVVSIINLHGKDNNMRFMR